MLRRIGAVGVLIAAVAVIGFYSPAAIAQTAGAATWQDDLKPIAPADWNYDFAAHLLERAGFGGTPDEIQALAKLTPAQAVDRLVRFKGTDASRLPPFDHSGIHDPGLEPFPPRRPPVGPRAVPRPRPGRFPSRPPRRSR